MSCKFLTLSIANYRKRFTKHQTWKICNKTKIIKSHEKCKILVENIPLTTGASNRNSFFFTDIRYHCRDINKHHIGNILDKLDVLDIVIRSSSHSKITDLEVSAFSECFLFIYLFIYLSIYLFIYLFVHLFIYSFIYLFIYFFLFCKNIVL